MVKAHPNTVKMIVLLLILLLTWILVPMLSDLEWYVAPAATIIGGAAGQGFGWLLNNILNRGSRKQRTSKN